METFYKKNAVKFLKIMDRNVTKHILDAIDGLTKKPPEGDIKSLKGTNNEYRLRVGKYRIIYHYENDNLVILDIGSRGDIYK